MTDKQKNAIASAFKGIGGDVDVRSMGLAKNQSLHPIVSDELDESGNLKCLHQESANGRPFLYIDSEEGVRISTSQLTRRGNGLKLTSGKQSAALEEWFDRVLTQQKAEKKCTLQVVQLFSRELSDGNLTRSAVFSESYA